MSALKGEISCRWQVLGLTLGLLCNSLYAVGSIAVQALDKLIPTFQLNVFRLIGEYRVEFFLCISFFRENITISQSYFNLSLK